MITLPGPLGSALASTAPSTTSTGFSLSPGGLLLPYHAGVLASLSYNGQLPSSAHLAGSSAGSIAVTAHATGVKATDALEGTIRVSDHVAAMGGARGNLLPPLRTEMETLIVPNGHEIINEREGVVGLAHRELFPNNRPVLRTKFDTKQDLIEAVCDSSMFPFFATNWPVRLRKGNSKRRVALPRVVVDGFFSVPRERYGCPDFEQIEDRAEKPKIDRVVTVCVFPHDTVGFTASEKRDQISPAPLEDSTGQMTELFRLATQSSSREELTNLYEQGWADAERWFVNEERYERERIAEERRLKRMINEERGLFGNFAGRGWN